MKTINPLNNNIMDFKTLLPDFEAIKKTDWKKPQVDTKNTKNLAMLVCAGLMLLFVFFAWLKITAYGGGVTYEGTKLGIATWYGVFAFVCALAAVAGCVYKHTTLTFCAAALGILFGLIGMMSFPEITVEASAHGRTATEVIKSAEQWDQCIRDLRLDSSTTSTVGAGLYFFASIATTVLAYLNIKK